MNYWAKKNELKKKATEHVKSMDEKFSSGIQYSVDHSKIYTGTVDGTPQQLYQANAITVRAITSVDAVCQYWSPVEPTKSCVLNFASHKNPGGMFLEGSSAQEESLCHESTLYNVLSRLPEYYEENRKQLNRSLYTNRAIYSPRINFGITYADVLTCAAPNKTAAQKYCNVSDEENSRVLRDRIDFVLSIAAENKVEFLILGAYGCGVFGQNPTEVANIFKEFLESKYKGVFRSVIFAIPDASSANFQAFDNVFAKYKRLI